MRLARALLGLGACILLCGCGFNGRTERPVPQPHRDAPAETAARERNSRPKERTLRLACNEWPPYVLKAGSEREGFAVDLTREALRRMGWRLEFLNRPWARGVEEMRRGELDGLICAYRAPGRTWAFHDVPLGLGPEWSDEFVILKRKGSGWMYRAPEDLQSARLALVDGYAYPEPIGSRLKAGDRSIVLVTGDDPTPRMVELVAMGRADATVEQRLPLEAVFRRDPGLASKVQEAGTLPGWKVYVALREDFPGAKELLEEFDRRLLECYRSRDFAKMLERYGLKPAGAGGSP